MIKNKLIVRGLSLFVLLLVSLAIYQRANEGVSGLLWGWKDALPFDQSIDISALGATFGVYDNEQKFAESNLLAIEHIFISWLDDNSALIAEKSKYASERDRWLLLTIEPWVREDGVTSPDTLFADIGNGTYDDEIRRACGSIAAQGQPVLIRWGHEMDAVTGRYPWAQHNAKGYIKSYRYFVRMCREIAPASWYAWSPIADGEQMYRYWPGQEYVDWIGVPVFSFPERDLDLYGKLRSFSEIFEKKYQLINVYQKKIMVAELGVVGDPDYQKRWMREAYRGIEKFPLLMTLVYFDSQDSEGVWGQQYAVPDWRIDPKVLQ